MALTRQEWANMFDALDESKDGSLSIEELDVGLKARNINVSNAALKSVLKSLDVNCDGKVSKAEFVEAMCKPSLNDPNALENAFKKFDTDGSGYITKQEMSTAMKSVGMDCTSKEIDELMNSVNKGGRIYYEDFVKALQ